MKKFQFPLEGYLKIKKIEEDKKMGELATVIGKIEREKEEINAYYSDMELYLKDKKSGFYNNVNNTVMIYEYLNQLNKKRKVAQRNIDSMQDELKDKQLKANEARKNRRVIEILKEKKKEQYQYEVYQAENKELDEFNNRRKNKKEEEVTNATGSLNE